MITKYNQFNESVKSLLVGPTDEEVLNSFKKLHPDIILLKSIENGFVPGIKYAIENGVDVTYDDNKLLIKCVINNNYDLVKSCLEHGADVHAQYDYSIIQSCEYGYLDIVKLLLEYDADIYIDDSYPLLISSAKGHTDVVKLLLDNGKFNRTVINKAIDYAKNNNEYDIVKILNKYTQSNESIKSLLVGPTKEEVFKSLGCDRSFETPEEFLLYMIDGMKIKEQNKYPNSIIWEKDSKVIFEQDLENMGLYVDHKSIWSVFEIFFGLKYGEIQPLIKGLVEEHLNWKGFTPVIATWSMVQWWKNM